MNGFVAVLIKELMHIRRERSTIFFAIVVPALQLTIFGFAANVTIENIPLVVLDLDGRQESRQFIDATVNTSSFRVVRQVASYGAFRQAIRSGEAQAGLVVPPDFTESLLRQEQTSVQLLVDGSDSQVALAATNAMSLLATSVSLGRARSVGEATGQGPSRDASGGLALPIEARVRLLYNPDLEDSRFFVPGLVGIILQFVLTFLTSFSIVRERERGTLEQLFVTPVSAGGLLLGKLTPYVMLAAAELLLVLILMVGVFDVPIRGSLPLLLATSLLFIVTVLALGLLVSTIARTQLQALQVSFLFMLPSVLLSGFVFPRSEMPLPLWAVGFGLPVTHFLEILRGVVLRGSDLADVSGWIAGLACCTLVIAGLSLLRFEKQL